MHECTNTLQSMKTPNNNGNKYKKCMGCRVGTYTTYTLTNHTHNTTQPIPTSVPVHLAASDSRVNVFKKGAPNMTAHSFCSWVMMNSPQFYTRARSTISVEVSRAWLQEMGFIKQKESILMDTKENMPLKLGDFL